SFMLPNIEELLGVKFNCENPPEELGADIPALPPMSAAERASIPKRNTRGNGRSNDRQNNHRRR
ncbi:MAG: hypothetical protein HOM06_06125, partial [Gammaproteobacteria bacterium]|nr:hypothetical protein [Gammaproteobacteria bacterium]